MRQLLFYERPRQLNRAAHASLRMTTDPLGFAFASEVNSVPVVLGEFAQAGLDYPIVFAGARGAEVPAALLGLLPNHNLFVDDQGRWADGAYVPAFVRRYPFVLAGKGDAADFTVCIDEAFPGLTDQGGEPLFNADGTDGPVVKHAVAFLSDFQQGLRLTEAFTRRLRALDLLVEKTINVQGTGREPSVLQGLWIVDESRLRALKPKQLQTSMFNGDLAAIYAHLQSLHGVRRLSQRLDRRALPAPVH